MNFNEFKCWLEGYSYSFKGAPNEEQWALIQEKLKEVIILQPSSPNNYDWWRINDIYPSYTTCNSSLSFNKTNLAG